MNSDPDHLTAAASEAVALPPLPPPAAWLEIDEDELGRPVYKAVHQAPLDIRGEHRRAGVHTADDMRAFARAAVLQERERCERICADIDSSDEQGWVGCASYIGYAIRSGEE